MIRSSLSSQKQPAAKKAPVLAALSAALLLGGCAVTSQPYTPAEFLSQASDDLTRLMDAQDPVDKPITLADAVQRAISYNLDHQVKLMEEALVRGQLQDVTFMMLPQLMASAGYSHRSEYAASTSESLLTGQQSLELSKSAEKDSRTTNLSFAWNLLDFGVSYVQAKQTADQVLITRERRRKALQNLILEVRVAYWQAASAQALLPRMDTLLKDARRALANARKLEKEKLEKPQKAMEFQAELLERIRQLITMRRQMVEARSRLATLLNIKPGTPFTLAVENWDNLAIPQVTMDVPQMEEAALANRPEIRESFYQKRVGALEARKALLRMLPGIELSAGHSYDANRFLAWKHWNDVGARLTFNLMSVFSGPSAMRTAEAQERLAYTQQLAFAMAAISQVNIAYHRYNLVQDEYDIVTQILALNQRRAKQAAAAMEAQGGAELEVIRNQVGLLLSRMQRDMAYAELQSAYGRILNSMGSDGLTMPERQATPNPSQASAWPAASSPQAVPPQQAAAPAVAQETPPQAAVGAHAPSVPPVPAESPAVPARKTALAAEKPADPARPGSAVVAGHAAQPAVVPGAASSPPVPPERYVLQLGSFSNEQHMARLQDRLNMTPLSYFRQEVVLEGRHYTRLRAGPYSDHDEALQVAQRLEDQTGIKATVAPYGY